MALITGHLWVHDPSVYAEGGSEDLRRAAGIMDAMKSQIVSAYQAKTGLTEERLAEMMSAETWLTADEALALGFVDAVVPAEKTANQIRTFNLSRFKNAAHVTQRAIQNHNQPQPKIENMSAFTSQEIENKVQERLAEFAEMDAIVGMVKKRDKKDFTALAEKARRENWTLEEFRGKLLSAEKWGRVEEVVGSGPEDFTGGPFGIASRGTLGDIVCNDPGLRAAVRNGWASNTRVQIHVPNFDRFSNATLSQSGSGLTSIEQRPEVILQGVQRILVMDLLGQGATNNPTIRYIRESAFTNAATTVAEGASKPEATLELDQVDATVKKVAVFTRITDEMLQDFPQLSGYINTRLPLMVMITEEAQILGGDGLGSNLAGLLSTPGLQTRAVGADANADALYNALTLIRVNAKFEPDGWVVNPLDWETLRLSKDLAKQYYGGGPFTGAYGQKVENVETLWGKPVAITTAIPQGTALAGAFKIGAEVTRRMGLVIDMSNSEGDNFVKNLTTIRAESRLALQVFHPAAFCQVTGL